MVAEQMVEVPQVQIEATGKVSLEFKSAQTLSSPTA